MKEAQISLVPKEYVPDAWQHVWGFIDDAVAHTGGRYTLDDVYTLIMEHGYLLWVALLEGQMIGAVVTCFVQYPRKKVLNILFLAGDDGDAWKAPILSTLRRFATDNDCDIIEASGREGWARRLKFDGFTPLWHTFEIAIEPEAIGA